MFQTHIELICDKPGCKNKLSADGPKAGKADIFAKVKAENWQWISTNEVYCPDHRTVAKKAAPAKKAAKTGKAGKPVKPVAKKGKADGKPIAGAVSTGKLAKSARTTE